VFVSEVELGTVLCSTHSARAAVEEVAGPCSWSKRLVTVTESSESNGEATERIIRLGARRAAVLPRCCSWRQRCSSDAAGQCRGRSDRAQPGGDQAAAGRRASLGRLPAAGPCGVGT